MPYHVHIDEAARTIVVSGTGRGTTDETIQLIADMREVFRTHAGFNLLYDSSALEIESSPTACAPTSSPTWSTRTAGSELRLIVTARC